MLRKILIFCGVFALAFGGLLYTVSSKGPTDTNSSNGPGKRDNIVAIEPWGPDQATFDEAIQYASNHPAVLRLLRGSRNRMISFQPVDRETKDGSPRMPPSRYRAIFYDYLRNKSIIAEGPFDRSEPLTITESFDQIPPSNDEFEAAVEFLKRDKQMAANIRNKKVSVYPPMPPVLYPSGEKDRVQRTIFVGLRSSEATAASEVVGVNMITGRTVRYDGGAPPTSLSTEASCGLASSGGSNGRGIAGSARVTISKPVGNAEQVELWDFMVNRPSSSSGMDGSGIELMDIKYKGKMVLKRLQIPVLNVQYTSGCGPFRDWQYAEGDFQTPPGSTDPAPGFRFCPSPATTIVENRSDAGNFRGVAIYNQNGATVLVTEMNAGWYRYLNEYQFLNDGTIKSRYGYGSTTSSCVCIQRTHHSYWRMDFDVNGANNSVYQTSATGPPVLESTEYTTLRNAGMGWIITDPSTGDSVTLTPNVNDGTALGDSFGQSDVWLLRFKTFPTELDDTGTGSAIDLSSYLNGEATNNQDIVIWYGTHIKRSDDASFADDQVLNGIYTPGPDIKANW